jgi:phosphatidylglycerophosphatase A
MTALGVYVATVGGTGYAPFAPGTVGSAVGVAIYLVMFYLGMPASFQVGLTVIVIIGGTWAAGEAARHFQQEDPSPVVVDEVAGQMATLVLTGATLKGALIGFVVFRVLDVIKPWPASRFERLHGGVGIMADDVMVALYGNLILQAVFFRFPDFA